MMPLPSLNTTELKAQLTQDHGGFRLALNGRAETPQIREQLRTLFTAVDQTLRGQAAAKVTIDFNLLAFINSSCFMELVVWLTTVGARAANEQYKLVFLSNPAVRWQRASLHSLATFAINLVEII